MAVNAQLNGPQGVGVDPSGSFLCIADTGNSAVRQVNLSTGIIITIGGIMADSSFDRELKNALAQIEKQFGKGAIMQLGEASVADVPGSEAAVLILMLGRKLLPGA